MVGSKLRVLLFAVVLVSCSDCDDEIQVAGRFLETPANLTCESDADCTVVSTGCHTFEGGICSQAQLNRTAAASDAWQKISEALLECESGCGVCGAALAASCVDGFCGGPR